MRLKIVEIYYISTKHGLGNVKSHMGGRTRARRHEMKPKSSPYETWMDL